MFFAVDTVDEATARLVADDETVWIVRAETLPEGIKCGDVLSKQGEVYVYEKSETERRRSYIDAML